MIETIRNLPRLAVIAIVILVTGLIRLPLEDRIVKDLREDGFFPRNEAVSAKEKLGTQAIVGILGGLRYLVATFFSLEAINHWENQEWNELGAKNRVVNLLSPRNSKAWANSAWHDAYNASAWYMIDDRENSKEVRELLMLKHIERGKEILREGIQWNPKDAVLYRDLANIYRDKDKDVCKTAEYFLLASQQPNAMSYMYRFYGYFAADCPGKEEEAYKVLMGIYIHGKRVLVEYGDMIWKPSLIIKIKKLEEKLGVPQAQRIPEYVEEERLQIISPLIPKQ